jgi:hypothetical protein
MVQLIPGVSCHRCDYEELKRLVEKRLDRLAELKRIVKEDEEFFVPIGSLKTWWNLAFEGGLAKDHEKVREAYACITLEEVEAIVWTTDSYLVLAYIKLS